MFAGGTGFPKITNTLGVLLGNSLAFGTMSVRSRAGYSERVNVRSFVGGSVTPGGDIACRGQVGGQGQGHLGHSLIEMRPACCNRTAADTVDDDANTSKLVRPVVCGGEMHFDDKSPMVLMKPETSSMRPLGAGH